MSRSSDSIPSFLVALVAAAALSASPLALAHAKLKTAEPKADSVNESSPKVIHLGFNTPLEPAFSKIELLDASEAAIPLSAAEVGKDNDMRATVPALKSGQYHVKWTAMTRDGHKVKGDYKFSVK